jgi:CheY-like chemotaxis protein
LLQRSLNLSVWYESVPSSQYNPAPKPLKSPEYVVLGYLVEASSLREGSILIVEDEPLIALDLETFLHGAGAKVLSARSLDRALQLVDHAGLSAAVLDCKLAGGDCEPVCARLLERGIPFLIYSGHPEVRQRFPNAVIIQKPAALSDVVDALSALFPAALGPAAAYPEQTDHAPR